MKSSINKLLVFISLVGLQSISSCGDYGSYGPEITSPIVITNSSHHIGDNTGAEGMSWSESFDMPSDYSYVELAITFEYPNQFETSGPMTDEPPEITINGSKIGVWVSDLSGYPDCISDGDFNCTITLYYNITEEVNTNANTFKIKSVGFYNNYDDFTFSNVSVTFE